MKEIPVFDIKFAISNEQMKIVEDFAIDIVSHLADWSLAEAPTGYRDEETEKRQAIIYSTILDCIELVDEHVEKWRKKYVEDKEIS